MDVDAEIQRLYAERGFSWAAENANWEGGYDQGQVATSIQQHCDNQPQSTVKLNMLLAAASG